MSVVLEKVDFLDTSDGLQIELFQGSSELLVVGGRRLDNLLDLATGRALAANADALLHLGEFLRIHLDY